MDFPEFFPVFLMVFMSKNSAFVLAGGREDQIIEKNFRKKNRKTLIFLVI